MTGVLEGPREKFLKFSYRSLTLELIVVILGILIAFQIDRWAELRRDHQHEYEYLLRLKEDLQIEMRSIDAALRNANNRIANVILLEEVSKDPPAALGRFDDVAEAVEKATWRSFPQINAFVYMELQSTGNLALIKSETLRRELANHYTSIRHYERVGLDLNFQHHFDLLTAGILSTAELRAIERGSWDDDAGGNISADRANEIVQELARRKDAIALLPNIAQHHVFNLKVMEAARARAEKLIQLIDSLLGKTER